MCVTSRTHTQVRSDNPSSCVELTRYRVVRMSRSLPSPNSMAVFRNANGRTCAHVSSSSLGNTRAQIHRHILVIDTFWRCIGCWENSLTSFPEWTPYRPPSVPFLEEPVCARHNRELRVLHTLGSTWRSTYYSLIPVFRFAGDRFSRHRRNVQSMQQPQLF